MIVEITYAKNAYDIVTGKAFAVTKSRQSYDMVTHPFEVVRWSRGDPIPEFGKELGIDTETELITDTCKVPPLVVLGVYNPADNKCYIVDWQHAQLFMHEILIRDCTLYFANAGFDYYELWSEELQQAASDRRVIDILIRGALKEIATVGYIMTYSLKDACKFHLHYAMNKHEEDGDASVRLNFKRGKPVSDEECQYLGIDCITTYMAGHLMGPQPTEDTHTLGTITLTHVSNNGMLADMQVFNYCEELLKAEMEKYRQELIQFGFPDPLKKNEKTEMETLEEEWRGYITYYFRQFYEEVYSLPFSIPSKGVCKKLILYGMDTLKKDLDKTFIARTLTCILMSRKANFNKGEQESWEELVEDLDFLVPCDVARKKCIWPLLLKAFLDKFAEDGSTYESIKEALDEYVQDHADWFAEEPPIKRQDFIQERLKKIEQDHRGLQFPRTEKTDLLKCSKKNAWILEDYEVKDPFLDSYMNFIHVQKYLSTFCHREFIGRDNKVHPRYGVVATGRTSCTGPNVNR